MNTTELGFDDIQIGQQHILQRTVTAEDVHTFGHLSGDFNPLHMDENFAAQSPFGRRVVHGMFSAALVSTAHTNLTGPGFVYVGQELNFKGPVFIGDTLTVTLTVTGKKQEKGILVLEVIVTNQEGSLILQGKSALMELDRLKARREG
jgi:3-hydroxybutyryl-CoA dehydratase